MASVVCTPSGKKSIFFGKDDDVVDDGNVDDDDAVANEAFEYLLLSVLTLVKTLRAISWQRRALRLSILAKCIKDMDSGHFFVERLRTNGHKSFPKF